MKNIYPGLRVQTHAGEQDTDDGGGERKTAPGSWGHIKAHNHSDHWDLVFPNGAWVVVTEAELQDAAQYKLAAPESLEQCALALQYGQGTLGLTFLDADLMSLTEIVAGNPNLILELVKQSQMLREQLVFVETIRLPSADRDGPELQVILPYGTHPQVAVRALNDIIHAVNREDSEKDWTCLDGNTIEDNLRARAGALGYVIPLQVGITNCWDEFDPDYISSTPTASTQLPVNGAQAAPAATSQNGVDLDILARIATARSGGPVMEAPLKKLGLVKDASDGWTDLTAKGRTLLIDNGYQYFAKEGWRKVPVSSAN